jgi:GNAT superfamily N-acetyltransferase
MEYRIRTCEEKDLTGLLELCGKHAAYEEAAYNPEGKDELLSAALFSTLPKLFCHVVETKGQLAGYFTYTFDFSTWDACEFLYLDCLYLEPEIRGYGIGEEIIRTLQDVARKRNCVNLQWQTPVFNQRAIKFYKRIGARGKKKCRFTLEP